LVTEDKKTASAIRTTDKQTDIFGLRINTKHVSNYFNVHGHNIFY